MNHGTRWFSILEGASKATTYLMKLLISGIGYIFMRWRSKQMRLVKDRVSMFSIHENVWDFQEGSVGSIMWKTMAIDWTAFYSAKESLQSSILIVVVFPTEASRRNSGQWTREVSN
jgi:hypothetical protein